MSGLKEWAGADGGKSRKIYCKNEKNTKVDDRVFFFFFFLWGELGLQIVLFCGFILRVITSDYK